MNTLKSIEKQAERINRVIEITVNQDIRDLFPNIRVGVLTGKVTNSDNKDELWSEIQKISAELKQKHEFESIREIPPIKSGKQAYRLLGKDPNRYRISAEAMTRRIVKGNSLYHINTLVDTLNLVSLKSGVTIGGFDLNRISGPICMGIGEENEEFEAIGRGELNIHRLPVYRDSHGAIGSPTSDCTRTMMIPETEKFLMLITDFFNELFIEPVISDLVTKLTKYAKGTDFEESIIS